MRTQHRVHREGTEDTEKAEERTYSPQTRRERRENPEKAEEKTYLPLGPASRRGGWPQRAKDVCRAQHAVPLRRKGEGDAEHPRRASKTADARLIRTWLLSYRIFRSCLAIESEEVGIPKDDSSRLVLVQKADAACLVRVWGLLIVPGCGLYMHRQIVYPLSRLGLPLRRSEGILVVSRNGLSSWYFFDWGRCVGGTSRFSHWCFVDWGLCIHPIFADPLGDSPKTIGRQAAALHMVRDEWGASRQGSDWAGGQVTGPMMGPTEGLYRACHRPRIGVGRVS